MCALKRMHLAFGSTLVERWLEAGYVMEGQVVVVIGVVIVKHVDVEGPIEDCIVVLGLCGSLCTDCGCVVSDHVCFKSSSPRRPLSFERGLCLPFWVFSTAIRLGFDIFEI